MRKKIEFVTHCPKCREELDLNVVQVQCHNPVCPSRVIGKILNYCRNLRIQNIGYETLETLHLVGLLNKGIRSLYKLKKKTNEIEDLDGFGKLKTRKIIAEIESKRRIKDYEFFGSIGIESLSIKTFQSIFSQISYSQFMDMIKLKNFDLLMARLIKLDGIGPKKAEVLVKYLKDTANRIEVQKLIDELSVSESYEETNSTKGKIVFSGCRPSEDMILFLQKQGFTASDAWTNKAIALVIPTAEYESNKVTKAMELKIPVIPIGSNFTSEIRKLLH